MKFLVVGGGSMGKRRIRCLMGCGVQPEQIRLVDQRPDRLEECRSKYGVAGFADLETGMKWNPAACLVSLPGERATEVAAIALESNKPVFCEVPLGATVADAERLESLARQTGVLLAPGAQQPFHPLVRQCREWLRDPRFGKPLVFHLEWGQNLRLWHPYENHRAFYSPTQLRGVMMLELIQFRYISSDRIEWLKSAQHRISTLEIEGPDIVQIAGMSESMTAVTMHFDLIQRNLRNHVRIASESGTIEIDWTANQVRRWLPENYSEAHWESTGIPPGYIYEQCYIDEIALFLQCINGESQWHNPAPNALDAMRCLAAIQRAADTAFVHT